MAKLVFVDCEATGPCPGIGVLTEFGAVDYETRRAFHGVLPDSEPDPANPALSVLTGSAYDAAEVFGRFREWLDGLGVRLPVDQPRLLARPRRQPVRPFRAAHRRLLRRAHRRLPPGPGLEAVPGHAA
jgi:hypothetical protein